MAGLSFAFNPDEGETPDTLAAKRAIAMALMSHAASSIPHNAGEGLALVGNRLAAALAMSNFENASQGAYKQFGDAMTGLLGGGATPATAPATPGPVAPGNVPDTSSPSIPTSALSGNPLANTPAPLSGGNIPAPQAATPDYAKAIASIESGGNSGEVGPATRTGDRALGKYQVMASNVPEWTQAALGKALTPQQFLASPQAQDAVFQHQFGQYVQKYGPEGAAKAWFAGPGGMNNLNASDSLGTTVASYARKFMNALGPTQANAAEVDPATAQLFSPDAAAQPLQPPAGVQVASLDNGMPASAVPADPRQRIAQALTQAPVGRFEDVGGPAPNVTNVPVRPATLPISNGRAAVAQALAGQNQPQTVPAQSSVPAIPPQVAATINRLSMIPLPQAQTMAVQLMQQYMKPHQYGFQTLPDGTVIRTDPMTGAATPIMTAIKPQFGVIGTDQFGNPVHGFIDTQHGTVKPVSATGANPQVPGGVSQESTLHGDDFLKTLPPALGAQVKAYAEGKMPLPAGFALKSPYFQKMLQMITQYDPSFDAVNYNARSKTRNDFTSGKSAQSINALNTVIGHLQTLSDAADNLNNTRFPALNSVENYALNAMGDPRIKQFDTTKKAVVDELTRVWRGSGGSEGDIKTWSDQISAANSPQQLHTVIAQIGELLQSKINSLAETYKQGMGTTAAPIQFVTPQSAAALKKLEGRASGNTPAQSNLPAGWSVQVH